MESVSSCMLGCGSNGALSAAATGAFEEGGWGEYLLGGSGLTLCRLRIWLRRGEIAGAGREADRIDEIFPLEMT